MDDFRDLPAGVRQDLKYSELAFESQAEQLADINR